MTKLEKLRTKIPQGIDALLITSEINQRYLTGFNFTDGYVLVGLEFAYLFTDFRYIESAKTTADKSFNTVMFEGKRKDWLGKIFSDLSIKTVGYEGDFLTCEELERLKNDFPEREFVSMGNILQTMREYKDEEEIQKIIKAQRIAESAFEHILGYINTDRREIDIALELEFFMRSHGAKSVSFDTIAVSGSASSLPHGEPRDIKLQKGFLTMDFGALYEGYCSDMTRTVCIGKADSEMKKVYNTVLNAQKAALDFIDFGKKCADCDLVAREIINKAGYEGCFGHSLGHGVGMLIHEAPRLSSMAGDKVLAAGHVVTIEPGIYIEGKYGVRIEDIVVFHDDYHENITRCTHELIEL